MLKILNASPGFGAPLTEHETVDFLMTGKFNIHLGTVVEKGHLNINPVWYYFDSANNREYMLKHQNRPKRHPILERTRLCIFV